MVPRALGDGAPGFQWAEPVRELLSGLLSVHDLDEIEGILKLGQAAGSQEADSLAMMKTGIQKMARWGREMNLMNHSNKYGPVFVSKNNTQNNT